MSVLYRESHYGAVNGRGKGPGVQMARTCSHCGFVRVLCVFLRRIQAIPRVNKELMTKFVGKEVCLVGKVSVTGGV